MFYSVVGYIWLYVVKGFLERVLNGYNKEKDGMLEKINMLNIFMWVLNIYMNWNIILYFKIRVIIMYELKIKLYVFS